MVEHYLKTCYRSMIKGAISDFGKSPSLIFIVAFLENATIGYSLESVCVCVCPCLCVCVFFA